MTNPLLISSVLDAPPRALLTEADAGRIATAIEAELAPSTRAMYAGAWRQWERWWRGRGLAALPAAPAALAAYLTERAEAGLTFGTLDGYCSGIAHRHHQEGLSEPAADVVVRRVRPGLRRIMGVAPRRQAHPLTVSELAQTVPRIDTDRAIGIRDQAVILLGSASAMRPGEIAALDVEDLTRERIEPRAVTRLVQQRANAGSTAFPSPATHCVPATPPPRPSTVPRSTESPPRPGTATSSLSSTITSDRRRRWRIRPVATSASDWPRGPIGCRPAAGRLRPRSTGCRVGRIDWQREGAG